MKKRIIWLFFSVFLIMGLVACGGKEVDNSSREEEVESDLSANETDTSKNKYSEDLKLFKTFYTSFYDSHKDYTDSDGIISDCFAKILINDNKAVMAIVDVSKECTFFDLYLFGTDGKEVVEVAKWMNVSVDRYICYGMDIKSIDDNLFAVCAGKEAHVYKISGNSFDEIYNNGNYSNDNHIDSVINTGLGKDGTGGSRIIYDFYAGGEYNWFLANDDYSINGSDFESLLDNMVNAKISDNGDVMLCFWDYINKRDNLHNDEKYILYWQDGINFELYEDGTAKVSVIDTGYENAEIPENVIGYTVDINSWVAEKSKEKFSQDIRICDSLRSATVSILASSEELYGIMTKNGCLIEIKSGVEPLSNAISVSGINNTDQNSKVINEIIKNCSDEKYEIQVKDNLDGSGILQESIYILVDTVGKCSSYISSSGKTIEEIKNDKEKDGVYRLSPDICEEYK
ncbi:MAG: hypothetical protein ACI4E1_08310 [Lachnospira sp.]